MTRSEVREGRRDSNCNRDQCKGYCFLEAESARRLHWVLT